MSSECIISVVFLLSKYLFVNSSFAKFSLNYSFWVCYFFFWLMHRSYSVCFVLARCSCSRPPFQLVVVRWFDSLQWNLRGCQIRNWGWLFSLMKDITVWVAACPFHSLINLEVWDKYMMSGMISLWSWSTNLRIKPAHKGRWRGQEHRESRLWWWVLKTVLPYADCI